MFLLSLIKNKMFQELKNLYALANYPFKKNYILDKLKENMTGINIETTNICNAKCIFCAYQFQKRAKGIMSDEIFTKTISDFIDCGGGNVSFTPPVGEPLLDKKIFKRIKYASSKPEIQNISFYTNMIAFGQFEIQTVLNSGISQIIISTTSFEQEMYKRIYRSEHWNTVFENIKKLLKANRKAQNQIEIKIDMRVDTKHSEVVSKDNYKEILGLIGSDNISIKYRYDDWGGKINQKQLSGTMKLRKNSYWRNPRITPCKELYNGPTIYWDGKVGACSCRDVDAHELIIGNIKESHLALIWQGDAINQLRNQFLTPKAKDLCKKCSHYSNLSLYCLPEYRKRELNMIKSMPVHLEMHKR